MLLEKEGGEEALWTRLVMMQHPHVSASPRPRRLLLVHSWWSALSAVKGLCCRLELQLIKWQLDAANCSRRCSRPAGGRLDLVLHTCHPRCAAEPWLNVCSGVTHERTRTHMASVIDATQRDTQRILFLMSPEHFARDAVHPFGQSSHLEKTCEIFPSCTHSTCILIFKHALPSSSHGFRFPPQSEKNSLSVAQDKLFTCLVLDWTECNTEKGREGVGCENSFNSESKDLDH